MTAASLVTYSHLYIHAEVCCGDNHGCKHRLVLLGTDLIVMTSNTPKFVAPDVVRGVIK